MKMMVLFTFLYLVTFILVIIYVAFVVKDVQVIFCSFANIPYKILNGNTEGTSKFLGLIPLTDTLTTLSANLGNFTTVGTNISAINNLSLGTKGQSLIDQVTTIRTAVTGTTTLDASATGAVS